MTKAERVYLSPSTSSSTGSVTTIMWLIHEPPRLSRWQRFRRSIRRLAA